MTHNEERLEQLELKYLRLADKIDHVEEMTTEMHTVFKAVEGGFKVIEWIGKIAKPLVIIILVCSALAGFFTSGKFIFKL